MCKGLIDISLQGIRELDADAGAKYCPAAEDSAGALESAILEELLRRASCGEFRKAPNSAQSMMSEVPPSVVAPPPGLPVLRPPPGLEPPPMPFVDSSHCLCSPPPRSCGTSDTGSTADATEEPSSPRTAMASWGHDGAIPSVGSAGHHLGLCKPCDFVDRGFCRAGASCRFCHLCGPAERRQRKLQRRKLVRAAKRAEGAE
mmetsp:Transcript_55991/g.162237  ORF Transcript_55991/g.162237 Transcript_55991/m.162237 type:complete len:202 (-) Transcript_55991:300-905(-)